MRLNTLSPGPGSKKSPKRLGRGIGSGLGKTCGRGHKGQYARAGSKHRLGFEGGQMPLHRRLPKFGFISPQRATRIEIRLATLNKIESDVITLDVLKLHGLINGNVTAVKIILSGELQKAVRIKGIPVTKGARSAIEKMGGSIETTEAVTRNAAE
jgi:large subunit ribosomal protein L15